MGAYGISNTSSQARQIVWRVKKSTQMNQLFQMFSHIKNINDIVTLYRLEFIIIESFCVNLFSVAVVNISFCFNSLIESKCE